MYPGTYINDLHLLAAALQEPASPTEPRIIQFLQYMFEYEDFKDPDDFQVVVFVASVKNEYLFFVVIIWKTANEFSQHTCMHLLRIFRCVCLLEIERLQPTDEQLMALTDALVNPKKSNTFGALYSIYRTAKDLVKKWICDFIFDHGLPNCDYRYGDVRVWNAENRHRPEGHESDPRSAVYVKTGNENVNFVRVCAWQNLMSNRPSVHLKNYKSWSTRQWKYSNIWLLSL